MSVDSVGGKPESRRYATTPKTQEAAAEARFANRGITAQQDTLLKSLPESAFPYESDSRQISDYDVRPSDTDKIDEDRLSDDSGISSADDDSIKSDDPVIESVMDEEFFLEDTRLSDLDDSGRGSVDSTDTVWKQDHHLKRVKRLGSGGNGVVDLVSSNKTQKRFALKMPLNNRAQNKLLREAELMEFVGSHANIVESHGLKRVDGKEGLLLEYIPGETLAVTLRKMTDDYLNDRISHSQFWGTFQYLLSGTLSGLEHLEGKKLSHQDIKPENVMVNSKTWQPVIIDLGSAGVQGDVSQAGTEFYMPPEYFVNEGKTVVSEKEDTYSVGQMVYSLLSSVVNQGTISHFTAGAEYDDLSSSNRMALLFRLHVSMTEYQKPDPDTGKPKRALTPISPMELQSRVEEPFKHPEQLEEYAQQVYKARPESRYMPLDKLVGKVLPDHIRQDIMKGRYAAGYQSALVEFVNRALHPMPESRLSAKQALQQPFIKDPLCDEVEARGTLKRVTERPRGDD